MKKENLTNFFGYFLKPTFLGQKSGKLCNETEVRVVWLILLIILLGANKKYGLFCEKA